jgi:hypothetical protein
MFWFKRMINNVRLRGGIQTFYDATDENDLISFMTNEKDFELNPTRTPRGAMLGGDKPTVAIHAINKSADKKPNTERFYELAKQAEVFISNVEPEDQMVHNDEVLEELDLPFPTVSFENLGDPPVIISHGQTVSLVPCVMVHEREPRQYEIYAWITEHSLASYAAALATQDTGKFPRNVIDEFLTGSTVIKLCKAHPNYHALIALVQGFIKMLAIEKIGEEKVKEHVKIGSGHMKESFTIRRVLHVVPRRVGDRIPHLAGKHIEFSHRWTVRGSWVRLLTNGEIDLNRIGKNREGEYCVPGWTWRIPHVKGPEDKPLIKKVRVIDGNSE